MLLTSSTIGVLTLLIHPHTISFVSASYTLRDDFSGPSLLSGFDFMSEQDPTKGWVRYLSEADAWSQGLVRVSDTVTYIGVDYTNQAPNGRASVRLQSKKLYHTGLFVLDLAHMPGTWPAFWTYGAEKIWPELGEIDIMEGIHDNYINEMSLHTADGCAINGQGSRGAVKTMNCGITAPGQPSNAGCGIRSSSSSSFGTPFNTAGGGVYAMQWTSSFIKIWMFPRNAIPWDLQAGGNLDPSTWGTPEANFQGACDFATKFGNQRLVIDTTFCGEWAGASWDGECKAKAPDCSSYVANNPGAFEESFWLVNSLKIYKEQ